MTRSFQPDRPPGGTLMKNHREIILNNLREAAAISSELPLSPADLDDRIRANLETITPGDIASLRDQFKNELNQVSGEFYVIKKIEETVQIVSDILRQNHYLQLAVTGEETIQSISGRLVKALPSLEIIQSLELSYPDRKQTLASVSAALVEASYAIADIGSLVFPYDDTGTSLPHFLADCVIVFVQQKNLLANQFELFKKMPPRKAKNMVFVTGPSRTADIEKVLILGAHGPRRLVVILADSQFPANTYPMDPQ
jgi:L-lactate dehydrogenase complex protein LldG